MKTSVQMDHRRFVTAFADANVLGNVLFTIFLNFYLRATYYQLLFQFANGESKMKEIIRI